MFRLFFRFLALLLLAGAFAALIVDGTRSVGAGTPTIMPLGRIVSSLAPTLFLDLRLATQEHLPMLWDPVLVTTFLLPAWLVLGAIGLLLMVLTRRRTPKVGYTRR